MFVRMSLLVGLVLCFVLVPTALKAQKIPCLGNNGKTLLPVLNDPVICTVVQLYGPSGLASSNDPFGLGGAFRQPMTSLTPLDNLSFQSPNHSFLTALNQTIAEQVVSMPLVTPATGISLIFDKSLGIYEASNESFGPILSERASTIGRHRLGLGFSYQYMNFGSLDGVDIHSFPSVFVVQSVDPASGKLCDPVHSTACSGYLHDFLTATNRINLKMNQFTAFATFGLTRRVDISVAVPVVTVTMSAEADTSIVPNSAMPGALSFNLLPPSNATCLQNPLPSSSLNSQYCSQAQFSSSRRSSGMGDVTVRVKAVLKSWERASFAAGLDVRVPTGDETNFLGAGAIGIRPLLVWSYRGRIAPHANVGYQWSGKSLLASNFGTAAGNPDDHTEHNLPGLVLYSVGAEMGVARRVTASIDLVGQTVINGPRVHLIQTPVPGLCESENSCINPGQPLQETAIANYTGTYAINDASLGLRFLPFGKFLISANVLLKLDNGGLRSKAIPMVSATYTF